jgi:cardiolipin synthase
VDDDLAAVGTANLDNRSVRLNFELTVMFADRRFAGEVAAMLEKDFALCRVVEPGDLATHSFWFRLQVPVARLMAPIQ